MATDDSGGTSPDPDFSWIRDRDALERACREWLRSDVLALDTEFVRERTFFPKLGLIQVASRSERWLIDAPQIDGWDAFVEVLTSARVVKILHSPSEDLEVFHYALGALPSPLWDSQCAATVASVGGVLGYHRLVAELYDVEIPKGAQRSNWLKRPLSDEQIRYALLDVEYLIPTYDRLTRRIADLDRGHWLEEEVDAMLEAARDRVSEGWIFRRLRRAGFDGRQLEVLRLLCDDREQSARRRDLPRGFVLKDEVLVDAARKMPRSKQALLDIKGLRPRELKRYGPRILAAVEQAESASPDQLPQPDPPKPRTPRKSGATQAVKQRLEKLAGRLDVPLEFLARRKLIETVVADARQARHSEGAWSNALTGWRRELLLGPIEEALVEHGTLQRRR